MAGGRSQLRTSEHKVQEGIEKLDQFESIIHVADIIEESEDDEDKDSPKADDPLNIVERGHGGGMDEKLSDGKGGEKILSKDGFNGEKGIQKDMTPFVEAKKYLITRGYEKAIRSKENILIYMQEPGVEFPSLG